MLGSYGTLNGLWQSQFLAIIKQGIFLRKTVGFIIYSHEQIVANSTLYVPGMF